MWGRLPTHNYDGMPTQGYDSMPTSFGIVQMLIHGFELGSVAGKPCTSQCPSVSVADMLTVIFQKAMMFLNYQLIK